VDTTGLRFYLPTEHRQRLDEPKGRIAGGTPALHYSDCHRGHFTRRSANSHLRLDLFGCDADRPFARIDQQGLCWLIAGYRLVDLSENAAIIETWTGARQTWRRRPNAAGRILAWEL
jgi:hypothetical protein